MAKSLIELDLIAIVIEDMKLEQATFLPEVSPVQIPNLPVRPK